MIEPIALGFADGDRLYHQYWEQAAERFHMVGKEIIRHHCLYWPAMLKAAALPVPTRVFAHGHLTKNGKKLSKTTGNVIDPEALIAQHGPDAVRYFLLREGSFGQDWDFTDEAFVARFNADLANDLGNAVSRALTMVEKFCEGRVPASADPPDETPQGEAILELYEQIDFAGALGEVWKSILTVINQEIVAFAPWTAAKDPARRQELEQFLYRQLERIRLAAVLVYPVIPRASKRIFRMLGLGDDYEPTLEDRRSGRLVSGRPLGAIEPLFPRIEKEKPVTEGKTGTNPEAAAPPPAVGGPIDIAEFARVELKVALVTAAEKIAGSKKLLKLQVDLGNESRQIVSGIADAYAPESLVGKKVVLVTNLKPAKLMGVESNGMVLAASLDGKAVLCTFDSDVPPGTRIK